MESGTGHEMWKEQEDEGEEKRRGIRTRKRKMKRIILAFDTQGRCRDLHIS